MNMKKFILIAFLIFAGALNLFAETKPVLDQASDISNTPHGNISSTDVQSAINELDSEKQPTGSYLTSESLFTAWQSSYDHHSNWDSAYGWGNHAGLYLPIGSTPWTGMGYVTGTPWTSLGYLTGITVNSPLSGAGTSASHLTVDLSSKLGLHATADDSAKLNGQSASYYSLATEPLSLHLDQATPQTTLGTFTFPSVNAAGSMKISSATSAGGVQETSYEASSSVLSGATSVIAVNIPIGAKVIGCQLNVDLAITSGDGGTAWSAVYSGGIAAQAICSAQAYARNTNTSGIFDPNLNSPLVAGSVGTVTISCDGGKTFSGGLVRAVVYYELFAAISPSSGILSVKSYGQSLYSTFANVVTQNQNTTAKTIDFKFDLTWTRISLDTGTDSNENNFYDRAWIFLKYSTDNVVWHHATLSSGGSITPETSDNLGAFVDIGTNQTLRWHYGANSVGDDDTIYIRIFAIEMVYIPQGAFSVGDGNTSIVTGQLSTAGATTPFNIAGEGAIPLGVGGLGNRSHAGEAAPVDDFTDATTSITLPTNIPAGTGFPKGYNAFYIMKYDISQGQYRDFLNTLTRAQQYTDSTHGRVATAVASGTTSVTNRYVMSNTTTVSSRNGIRCDATINGTAPITFYCDLDGNGTGNEADDGEWIGCNYLSWADQCAYADWAGLRPMTELEFEKACRGTIAPVNGEYAWGNTTSDFFSDLSSSSGTDDATHSYANEAIGPTHPTANLNFSSATPDGPVRCGMFATSSSTRTQAGASYYGVMELSGNLWKRPVTIGQATGRAFTGLNGDGALDSTGNANVTNWPGTDATGAGIRGGYWSLDASYSRVSDRRYAASVDSGRYYSYGGRCVRTSP